MVIPWFKHSLVCSIIYMESISTSIHLPDCSKSHFKLYLSEYSDAHTHTDRWLRLWVTPVEGTHCLWWAHGLQSWGQLHPLPVMYQYTCIDPGLGPSHLNTGNTIMEIMVSLCNKELRSWTDLIFKDTPWGTPTLTVAPKTLCREIFLSAPYSTMVPKKPALEWQNQELFRQRRHLNFSLLNPVIPKQVKHENAAVCSRCWPLEDSWCISKVRLDFPAC